MAQINKLKMKTEVVVKFTVDDLEEVTMESTWKLHHVGIPVRDLDKSLDDYKSLGMATFQPEFQIDSSELEEYLVYGKTPDPVVRTRAVLGQMGPLGIEL